MKYKRYKHCSYTYRVWIEDCQLLYDTKEGEYRLNIYKDGKYIQTYKYFGIEDIQQKSPHVMYPIAVAITKKAKEDMKNRDMVPSDVELELDIEKEG